MSRLTNKEYTAALRQLVLETRANFPKLAHLGFAEIVGAIALGKLLKGRTKSFAAIAAAN